VGGWVGSRDGQCLDHSGQLAELGGDAVAAPREQRDLLASFFEGTTRLRPQLVGLLAGGRHHPGALGSGTPQLVVGGVLRVQHLLGDLLAEGPGPALGLLEPMASAFLDLGRGLRGFLSDPGGVALAERPRVRRVAVGGLARLGGILPDVGERLRSARRAGAAAAR
jgi:hypothetical protein